MLFPPQKAGGHPSLLVEDGKTFTIDPDIKGLFVSTVRPRSVAALLALWGIPSPQPPPRLSDAAAFKTVTNTVGLVELNPTENEPRIGGHSAPYVRAVLKALDPQVPMPKSVRWRVAHDHTVRAVGGPASSSADIRDMQPVHVESEVPVPEFIHELAIYTKVVVYQDIVIGFGSTLVINVSPLMANNFLAYGGSRVTMNTPYLNLDVYGTMQGGIPSIIHQVVGKVLKVSLPKLDQIPVAGL